MTITPTTTPPVQTGVPVESTEGAGVIDVSQEVKENAPILRGNTVEVTFADGSAFDETAMYPVAMTSYRASGGGGLIHEGAGLPSDVASERVVAKLSEIRDLVYAFIGANNVVDRSVLADEKVIGSWKFIPEDVVSPLMKKDISLLLSLNTNCGKT